MFSNFISTKEASKKWGVSTTHLSTLCKNGKLICKRLGREWIIDADQDYTAHMTHPNRSRKDHKNNIDLV